MTSLSQSQHGRFHDSTVTALCLLGRAELCSSRSETHQVRPSSCVVRKAISFLSIDLQMLLNLSLGAGCCQCAPG